MICQAPQHILSINLLSITTFGRSILYSIASRFLLVSQGYSPDCWQKRNVSCAWIEAILMIIAKFNAYVYIFSKVLLVCISAVVNKPGLCYS